MINTGEKPSTALLNTIESPADLRKLNVERLPEVCADIRNFLIHSLSVNPGHFASSMGAVELTVALHYVFDTPYDRIVWDVGHQAYGHKLLTGRRDKFATNRTLGGLSGFPNPDESPYDTFSAGHASNSISAALGMAMASQLKHESPKRNIVAVIGDASISGGLAFEGINNAANSPNNLLIILNDNDMSIDHNVGALHKYLSHINTSKGYNDMRQKLYSFFKRHNMVTDRGRGSILRFNNSLKSLLSSEQNIFEGLNIRYFGPIDGHDIGRLVRVLNEIKDMKGPRILHVRTIKGKGYAPAEKDPATWHAPGKFDAETGERKKEKNISVKYQDVFGHTLLELARKNARIAGITAAMPGGTSMNVMQSHMPDRVFDVGISEGHAVTFAGGLAKDGMIPYCAIYSSFLQRGFDQIIHDVALQRLPVVFCIDRAGLVGEDGATHHGAFDMAYLRMIPHMTIAAPRNEHMLRNLMYTASQGNNGPFAIRYPRGCGKNPQWQNTMRIIPSGQGEQLREGSDVTILTIGTMADNALAAAENLAAEGIQAAIYDMVYVKPLDSRILEKAANSGKPIVTVEDGTATGGFGSAVAEWLHSHDYSNHVEIIGLPDMFITQGTVDQLHTLCGIDSQSITSRTRGAVLKYKTSSTQQ
ncbi:MAG: 1-deoxy-D-xylulose-5-phosphate synthase [Muribaculaceae bacterium]|nr:1-deoxy-D-xylulose-5-phosphate synthase [Muribaculaceae bacterium]